MIRVALAIIINKKGEILLQHRDEKAPTNPNKWGLWGGGIENGEESVQALIRELKEELDIDVRENSLNFFKVYREHYFGDDWEGHVFILMDSDNFEYTLKEGKDLRFCNEEMIQSMEVDPAATAILNDFLKRRAAGTYII